jgi:PPIC-type PPIASE domain
MKKKSDKVEKEVERDEDDEDDDDDVESDAADSDEGEEEEQERPAVSARAVADERRARRAAAARAPTKKSAAHDDHGHGHDHDDDEDESSEGEDPSWWAPHAVMSALVLIGVLGFFGLFNKILAPIAAHPAGQTETAKEESKPAEPSKAPTPTPQAPQPPQAPREMFAAKHLLVMYKGGKRAPDSVTRTKDEAKARATEAQKKAKEGKIKFEDLVKEYSDEPRAGERGGDLGTFPKGSMVPEFQAGLEKIKIGEISDVVESPFGFHVILRTQPNQPAMPPGH